jgi:hypothetical protein
MQPAPLLTRILLTSPRELPVVAERVLGPFSWLGQSEGPGVTFEVGGTLAAS